MYVTFRSAQIVFISLHSLHSLLIKLELQEAYKNRSETHPCVRHAPQYWSKACGLRPTPGVRPSHCDLLDGSLRLSIAVCNRNLERLVCCFQMP